MHRFRLVICLAIALLLVIPSLAFASRTPMSNLTRGSISQLGTVDVHGLPSVPVAQAFNTATQNQLSPTTAVSSGGISTGSSVNPAAGVTVSLTLNGVFGGAPNQCGCTPPDPNAAVGTNHVFMTANIAGIIYFKNGTIARSTFSLADFFKVAVSSEIGDPEVMFDSASGRWFVSSIVAPNNIEFAVSTTDDPTGTYVLYTVLGGSIFPDQPFIGTNNDKFVISVNAFVGNKFGGALFWVFSKAELVSGASTVDFVAVGPDPTLFSAHPARHLSSTTNFYLVSVAFGSATSATMLTVTGVPPGTVSVASTSFGVNPINNPPRATQPTTGTKLVTNDDRVLSAVWESNILWFSSNDACVPSGDAKMRSCIRLVEVSTSGSSATKIQDFDYSFTNTYLFYPAVSLSRGKLVVVFGESSQTVFPSLVVTGRLPTDPANTLQTAVTIRAGTANDESTRYGDYFGAATDPSGNGFWVSGEYRVDEVASNWSTAIAQVNVS